MPDRSKTRRQFLKTVATGAGAALSMPALSYGRILGSNERITVGLIGIGQQSRGHLFKLLNLPDAQVAALCDVYQPNLQFAANLAPGVETFTDFRRVLDRSDIDAV